MTADPFRFLLFLLASLMFSSTPASAAIFHFSGKLDSIQTFNLSTSVDAVSVDDLVSAYLDIDLDQISLLSCSTISIGESCVYDAKITTFTFSAGKYVSEVNPINSNFFVQNFVGQHNAGFAISLPNSGPYQSSNPNVFYQPDFDFTKFDLSVFLIFGGNLGTVHLRGPLDLTFSATAVPEPSIWILFILGFGWLGGRIRYSKRTARQALKSSKM
jgi:hypothetical protein